MPRDLASIYDEHAAFVWRTLRLLGVPEAALDDAVQEVFVVVHRRLADFQGRSSIPTWLYAIARRVAGNVRRSEHRQAAAGARIPTPEGPALDPHTVAERTEAGRILVELVASLTDEHRDVFVLVDVESMPVTEAAEALGLNLNTCYTRLRAARAAFQRALSNRNDREPKP